MNAYFLGHSWIVISKHYESELKVSVLILSLDAKLRSSRLNKELKVLLTTIQDGRKTKDGEDIRKVKNGRGLKKGIISLVSKQII